MDKGKGIELGGSMKGNATDNSISIQIYRDSQIIDSAATDHMTNNSQLLNNLTKMHDLVKDSVHLPNRQIVPIKYQGECSITSEYTFGNVL